MSKTLDDKHDQKKKERDDDVFLERAGPVDENP